MVGNILDKSLPFLSPRAFVRLCWVTTTNRLHDFSALTPQKWTSAPGTVLGRCLGCQGSCPPHGHSRTQAGSSFQGCPGGQHPSQAGEGVGRHVCRGWHSHCHPISNREAMTTWPPLRARMAGRFCSVSREEQILSDISGGSFLEWEVRFPAMRTHTGCWVSSHLSRKAM